MILFNLKYYPHKMPIPQTFTVIAPVAPSSNTDTYPVTLPIYGKGGLRTVANINERNAIFDERRERGMLVYVESDSKYYTLTNGITNNNWQQVTLVNTDVNGNIHISGNLIVSGYVQTSTGIQGDPDVDVEYLGNDMSMDCGEY